MVSVGAVTIELLPYWAAGRGGVKGMGDWGNWVVGWGWEGVLLKVRYYIRTWMGRE